VNNISFSVAGFKKGDRLQKVFVVTALCVIVGVGLFLRVGSLSNWLDHKERYFFADQQIPLMLTVDSYYYLELARQLQEGTFKARDERRRVPVGYDQPATPPLLSVLLARISTLTGASLEWIALFIPAFLGILLAIPVYLLSCTLVMKARVAFVDERMRHASARVAGLFAALVALLSPLFSARSAVGWCDTDALNVTFPVLLAYLAIKCADSERLKEQILFSLAFAVSSLLFLWWWDQSHIPVFAFVAIPFVVALFFIGLRSSGRLLPIVSLGVGLILIVGLWKGFDLLNPFAYLDTLNGMARYISGEVGSSPFRATGAAVSEQSGSSLTLLMRESSGGLPSFVLACLGLLALTWLCRGYFLYLTPLIVVSVLSLKGQRFLIFTAPLFGIGIGTLCFLICRFLQKPVWRMLALALLLGVSCWYPMKVIEQHGKRVPRRAPILFDAMQQVNQKTEKDAVIWASWGHGHPLLFYGQRGIVADGIFHSAKLQYVLSFPLATGDFRLAANWISFYVANGPQGLSKANSLFAGGEHNWSGGMEVLQELLKEGVQKSRKLLLKKYQLSSADTEKTLEWLFPGNSRPVYLFLDYLLVNQAWFTIGRWDLESRSQPEKAIFVPVQGITVKDGDKLEGVSVLGKVTVDLKTGKVQTGKGETALGVLKVHNGKRLNSKRYKGGSPLYGEFFLPGRMGVLAGQQTVNTALVKLYYEYTYNKRFFLPIDVGKPSYSIWKVTGEKYSHRP
jgi:oligosaccharyl transferase STT3 subunit